MKNSYYLFLLFFCFSCSDDDTSNVLQIRVINASEFDYKNIVVNTSGGEQNYGDLDAGQTSVYKTFDFAYRFAYVELQIDDDIFIFQPIDYIEENLITSGNYSYEISANDSNDQFSRLNINLRND
ncbi:hypothetical protein [Kordia sp. SMS9]|uniref:hypothetical protein n=1 Tax=Kordia sp. SMS9 TaxID=2282170 RepID=UPI000E0CFE27|nr:hypothetical protein [Kordia sp. SMS9]